MIIYVGVVQVRKFVDFRRYNSETMSKKSKLKLKRANQSSKSGTSNGETVEMANGDKAEASSVGATERKWNCCLPIGK